MTAFTKSNKVSHVYISSDKIDNFKFKVIFKEVGNVISIPKLEILSLEDKNEKNTEKSHYERSFSWQQKFLSAYEINKYSDMKNCSNDVQKNYNQLITEKSLDPKINGAKIFSYVNGDDFEEDYLITTNKRRLNPKSEKHFFGLHSKKNETEGDSEGPANTPLLKDMKKPNTEQTKRGDIRESMFILIDMNNYDGDPNYSIKREHTLFSLIWYPNSRSLVIYPDFNQIVEDPYILETNYDCKRLFHYSIEIVSDETIDDAKKAEIAIIDKINLSRYEAMSQKIFKIFSMPPKNILTCYVIFEIISGDSFEYDNLYIEYQLDLPHGFSTTSDTEGVTQISSKNKIGVCNFGHVFELDLSYHLDISEESEDNSGVSIPEPEMYFEVISCDYWGRHRTEGFCFVKIPVSKPGKHNHSIQTILPQSSDHRLWQMNRYFIGGRHTLNEISWIGTPSGLQSSKLSKYGVKTVPSGKINIEINTILQNRYLLSENENENEKSLAERVGTTSLFKSVNSVLMAYKEAKEKLKIQQKQLNDNV